MIIPSSFNMFGHTITVKYDNKYCAENECYGEFIYWENTIVLANKYKTEKTWRKYKESIIEHTFYHELGHCVLYYTGYADLWLDEKLVDLIGALYHQYEISKTIETNGKRKRKSRSNQI